MTIHWTGDPPEEPAREPGELFREGDTYLVANGEEDVPRIVNFMPDSSIYELLGNDSEGAIVLRVNSVIERVRRELGLPALEQA